MLSHCTGRLLAVGGSRRPVTAAALHASQLHTTGASAGNFKTWRNTDSSSRAAADTGSFRQWRRRNITLPEDMATLTLPVDTPGAAVSPLHTTVVSTGKFKTWRNTDSSSRAAADTGTFRQWRRRNITMLDTAGAAVSPLCTTGVSAGKFKPWREVTVTRHCAGAVDTGPIRDSDSYRQQSALDTAGTAIGDASIGRLPRPGAMAPWRALSRAENQEIDRFAMEELAMPSLLLMENAGLGLTAAVVDELEVFLAWA